MQNIFKALFFIIFSLHIKTLFCAQNEQSSGYFYLQHNHEAIKNALNDLLTKAKQRYDDGENVFYDETHGMYVSSRPGRIEPLDDSQILMPTHWQVADKFFSERLNIINFNVVLQNALENATPYSLLKELK